MIVGERIIHRKDRTVKIKYISLLIIVFLSCNAYTKYKSWYNKRPCDQPYSQWQSEDETVYLNMGAYGTAIGSIRTKEGVKNVYFKMGLTNGIDIYEKIEEKDGRQSLKKLEHWLGDFQNEREFIATVIETVYFEQGQKIKLHQLEKNERPLEEQPNTKWASDDGTILLTAGEQGTPITGSIQVGDDSISILYVARG